MKNFVVALLLTGSAFIGTSASANFEDEQWPIPNEYGKGHHSVLIEDSSGRYDFFSLLRMRNNGNEFLCKSFLDQNCSQSNTGAFNALLPPCGVTVVTDCILSLEAISPKGDVSKAVFKEYIYGLKHPNLFEGDGIRTPKNVSEPGVWTISGAPHVGGVEYALSAGLSNAISNLYIDLSGADLDIQLYPISRLQTGFTDDDANGFANYYKCIQKQDSFGKRFLSCGGGAQEFGKYRCAMKMIEDATCLLRNSFPANFRYRVKLQLSHEPPGMMHGRLTLPNIEMTKNKYGAILEIEAGSVRVPILYSGSQYESLSTDIREYWDECVPISTCGLSSRVAFGNDRSNPRTRNIQDYAPPFGDRSLNLISIFSSATGDKSVAAPTAWNIKTLSKEKMSSAQGCLKRESGFVGVVTTNSTTYSEGPPSFVDGSLSYKVASLHYLPNGDEFLGTYNLILRSDAARCLYGYSQAPISATISVISSDGKNQVATTVVKEKGNWLYLSAAGFTFSSPTINVKLSQESKVAGLAETATPVTKASIAPAKTSLTCIKGKTTKKVTAINPKCPSGYKKKG